ncbi:hypothetical protein JRQ81_009905 [Phrynocephalus forsythii]|uniref:Forkhead-associated domain-containing protein 1 n=1 Tax=Phrynocephalus forsythii TaxID=171643 RepID=A0A9Q0XB25_9SAUR|nr:hypothetical protein JRQ81_009905 [Phrynocephalus forsythii]
MKAYLKSSDGLLALQPKITTIGRHEDSDIVLKSTGADDHHAAIEFSPLENGFVLRDFNSAHGTFVNDCHIQNAAVKVSPGDQLRFGFGGTAFELVLENASQVTGQRLTSLRSGLPASFPSSSWPELKPSASATAAAGAAPQFPSLQSPQSPPTVGSWTYGTSGTSPRPPHRKKPMGAWGRPVPSLAFSPDLVSRTPAVAAGNGAATGPLTHVPQEEALLKERDDMVLKLGNEIGRLSGFEQECHRKDALIAGLQREIAALTEKLAAALAPRESAIRHQLAGLDQDVAAKAKEIQALKEEIGNLKKNTSEVLYHSVSERDLQIAHWKQENEALKKNYSLTIGLVTSLQKEVTSKEQKVQQLKAEAERFRRESREKDTQLAQVSAQCSRIKEETKRELRAREVNPCKNQVAELELQVKRSEEELKKSRAERELLAGRLAEKTQAEGDLKKECEMRSQQLQEMGRRERLIKSDKELAATQAQRFRNQLVEVLFLELPERPIMEKLKQMQKNDEEFHQKELALKEKIWAKDSKIEEISRSMELLRKSLCGFEEFLKRPYGGGSLKKEILALQSLHLPPPASEIQASAADILCSLLSWVDAVEGLLRDVGLDVPGPEKGTASGVKNLADHHRHTMSLLQALQDQRRALEESQHLLLQERMKELKGKLEEEFQVKERELLEAEKEHRKILEGAAALQEAKWREAMDLEKSKVNTLDAQVNQLARVIEEKTKSEATLNTKLMEHLESLEAAKRRKTLAEERLVVWEKRLEKAEKDVAMERQKHKEEISEYQEQVRQHSRTIVELESKLVASAQQAQKAEDGNARLQKRREEMQREPCTSLPAASQVASCTETSHIFLKEELKAAKERIVSDEAVIAELRTELSGARARVSDIIGELSEKQKVELEQKQRLVHSQAQELHQLRESLRAMAQRAEQKEADLHVAREALRSSREKLQEVVMREAPGKREGPEKVQQHKSVQTGASWVEEAPAARKGPSVDLADVGARCRGSRHEETIRRQKDALAELRQRIRTLEKGHPLEPRRKEGRGGLLRCLYTGSPPRAEGRQLTGRGGQGLLASLSPPEDHDFTGGDASGKQCKHLATLEPLSPARRVFSPYAEFREFSRRQIKEMERLFRQYDAGKDGFIDLMELKLMMEKLGAPQTHLGLKNMIKEVDEDFDGKLSFREFLLIFRKAAAGELEEDSGLHALARLSEIDVSTEGVKGAKSFFEAKVQAMNVTSRFEEEIKAEQEEKRRQAEEAKQRKAAFKELQSAFKQ